MPLRQLVVTAGVINVDKRFVVQRHGAKLVIGGREQLADAVDVMFAGNMPCDGSILTNARQYDACRRAYEAMLRALQGLKLNQTPDLVLTDVEAAMEAMGEVTGATVREDITARIFERFCVGK